MAIMNTCCCCGVRAGSFVVAIYAAIKSAAAIIQTAMSWYSEDQDNDGVHSTPLPLTLTASWGISFGINSLLILAAICLFVGLVKDAKSLLVPYMVVECLYMLAYLALEVFIVIVLVNGNYEHFNFLNLDVGKFTDLDYDIVKYALIGLSVGIPVIWGIDFVCLLCVISQYQELRDWRSRRILADTSHVIVIQQQGYTTGFAPATYDPRPTPQQQYYSHC